MQKRIITALLGTIFIIVLGIHSASAAEIEVKITNITHGIYFTPLLVSAHDDKIQGLAGGGTVHPRTVLLQRPGAGR